MYVERVPNRNSPPAVLLREFFREHGKVKKRTLANLSKLPTHLVEGLRVLLKGGLAVNSFHDAFDIVRSRPHGHVAAVRGLARSIGLARLLGPSSPQRDTALALILARLLGPCSKLATARGLHPDTMRDSLGEVSLSANSTRTTSTPPWIGCINARTRSSNGWPSVICATAPWCPVGPRSGTISPPATWKDAIARWPSGGYSRDGKRNFLQIEFGLLCNRDGCPVAVEVFAGNTADPNTLSVQIDKLQRRFGLSRVVLVGDRGMLTDARIRDEVKPAGLDWISALRAPAIRELVESGAIQMSLFDQMDLVEIRTDAYPGERLMVCRNPLLAAERARKRQDLLQATERLLDPIVAATTRATRRLTGQDKIGIRVGKVIGKYKMAKHFVLEITEHSFSYRRNPQTIAAEAALDGLYIVRTNLSATQLDAEATVRAYKGLSVVERAFRSYKTVDLKIRPIYHYTADRVRAHVFICMLAYYLEWHLRQRLAPLLFDDHDVAAAERESVVAPAQPSPAAMQKARSKRTDSNQPVHSLRTLLDDLATITKNQVLPKLPGSEPFEVITRPTELQSTVFRLLGVRL